MDSKDLLHKYHVRLVRIGMVKSVFIGLISAFLITGAVAVGMWFTEASLPLVIGLSLGLGAATALICIPVAYFRLYRPDLKSVAARLDALGMDERFITMCEFENDSSSLAALQRADAQCKLSDIPEKRIKFAIPLQIVLMLVFSAVFAASFVTVSSLAATDAVTRGGGVIAGESGGQSGAGNTAAEEEVFTVSFAVMEPGTGIIRGKVSQTVKKGGFTDEVTAVPAEGYVFYAWVNKDKTPVGNQRNPLVCLNVRENLELYAMFYPMESSSDESDSANGGSESGDNNKPDDEKSPDSGDGGDSESSGESGGGNETEGGGGSTGDNPGSRENNSVIDGKQDYRDNFDRELYEEELAGDASLPDDLKDLLGDYFGVLKP